jgi:hypothetical protein
LRHYLEKVDRFGSVAIIHWGGTVIRASKIIAIVTLGLALSSCAVMQTNAEKKATALGDLKKQFGTRTEVLKTTGTIDTAKVLKFNSNVAIGSLDVSFTLKNQSDLTLAAFTATLKDPYSGSEYTVTSKGCGLKSLKPFGSKTCKQTEIVTVSTFVAGAPLGPFGASIVEDSVRHEFSDMQDRKLDVSLSNLKFSSPDFRGTIEW